MARSTADGAFIVGPQGFVEFVYKPGGKVYKSRPESFERLAGAAVVAGAPAPAVAPVAAEEKAPSPSRAPTPSKAKPHGARVTGSAAKKGQARVVDLSKRRGPENAVQLWTAGACSGNPGPAGLGVVFEHGSDVKERSEYLGTATNNIAELTAILRGLEIVLARGDKAQPVDVMTDSEYCIGLLGLGWKPKKNQELVASLRAAYEQLEDVLLVKVPGHAGVPGNERADELARLAISSRRTFET